MGGERFEKVWWRRREKRREREERRKRKKFFNLERERDEDNEIFLPKIQINILSSRNYHVTLALNVLKMTLLLFP
jgi:hypothetical protein